MSAFHDEIGHWNFQSTLQFVTDRFWWPSVHRDVLMHVRSCQGCQRAQPVTKYRTTLRIPLTELFDVFSLDFAGPFPVSSRGSRFILIGVEHLTEWPLAQATSNATAEVVIQFIREEIFQTFGPPERIMCNNATCFTANSLSSFINTQGTQWHTVSAYAPMS